MQLFSDSSKSRQKTCPECSAQIICMSKHLQTHGFSKSKIKDMSYQQKSRRTSKQTSLRKCPYELCASLLPYARLDHHLQRKHHLSVNGPVYRGIINKKHSKTTVETKRRKLLFSEFSSVVSKEFS